MPALRRAHGEGGPAWIHPVCPLDRPGLCAQSRYHYTSGYYEFVFKLVDGAGPDQGAAEVSPG